MTDIEGDLQKLQQAWSGMLSKMGRGFQDFHEQFKQASGGSGAFTKLNTIFADMSKSLIGPLGVAAGIYAVGKSLEDRAGAED